jgi:hypothetical protein
VLTIGGTIAHGNFLVTQWTGDPMPTRNLRQDTINPLPYLGTKNAQCFYWDQQLTGFGVRVYPTRRKTFVCAYRIQGRRRIATLGRADILKLDTARKKAVAYLGQVAEGLDPQAPKDTLKLRAR